MDNYETLLLSVADEVATITLNRPAKLNAATPQMFVELRQALEEATNAHKARCVVLTGAGRAFCSGADLSKKTFDGGSPGSAARRGLQQSYNPTLLALHGLDVPVISAVNGPAAGVGCALALSADFIVAGRSAYFLQAFANIGLVPDGGSTWLYPRAVGSQMAFQAMMLGERIHAEEAEQKGLIYKCVDDGELSSEVDKLAQRLANGPTLALGLMRKLIRGAQTMTVAEALNMEAEAQKIAGDSEDFQEGVNAFKEKRKSKFKGR